ncbi:hypothetical protein DL766_005564 [Monosporascus sp. MC13-8B]|uniref:Calcium-dependent cell adhesion molecule 1 membrane-binding domain-containing protein n=1 Tax=Monosporascus cannonballus TaxID=155416 RepID=A0ABY0GV17_9PEZI|nr:hypothetical protein DL762_010555 [Monosporascus cannonballus]RYO76499.1 hypothetical protein DL763_010423 [Monosporascus cannonballus]RYP29037.1 hypothetical protein DL766_005564 [Monosporascus sp. MC13-8B]
MAPTAASTEAWFYEQENFGGTKYSYKIGEDVNLYPGKLNDKFNSAAVGSEAKVLAWQHDNASGNYAELVENTASLKFIGGLTRFKVVEDDTRAVAFKFRDATGGGQRQYSLKIDAADVGAITLYAPDDADDGKWNLVGTIREEGPPVTTAVYIRDERSGVYIAVGSVFFQWNTSTKQVDIAENDNFPKQLSIERADASKFLVTLTSNEPSA